MPNPMTSGAFGDLLNPDFQDIFWDEYESEADMLPDVYNFEPTNGRVNMTWTQIGTLEDFQPWTGQVAYSSMNQGYDTTLTPIQFSNGVQVERLLFENDQYNVMNQKPRALAESAYRTRQKHGAQPFNLAASIDNTFYVNTENVALVSNSHTTASGASTSTGYDNLVTSSLTAVGVQAAWIQMRGFRGDQAEVIDINPDTLLVPIDLYEAAYEITAASGKVDTDLNNPNVHYGKYRVIDWIRLTDVNNWFMIDSRLQKRSFHWTDRIPLEFAMIEDFDTLVAKWRAYMVYGLAHIDWRWILGGIVS